MLRVAVKISLQLIAHNFTLNDLYLYLTSESEHLVGGQETSEENLMSDGWYYSDEFGQIGPLSLQDLKKKLDSIRNPADAFVWRAGFPDWMEVRTVAELSITPRRRSK